MPRWYEGLARQLPAAALFMVAGLALAAGPSVAQELLQPGTRVRIHRTPGEGQPVLGVLEAWKPDTLVVLSDSADTRVSVPVGQIIRFESSAGRGPAVKEGAQTGAIFGALAGLGIAALNDNNETALKYPLGGTVGMIAGAGVGAIVGSTRRVEQWQEVALPKPRPAGAPPELAATVRVRVTSPTHFGDQPRTGTLVTRDQASLTFLPDGKGGQPVTIATDDVKRLEIGEGRRHHAWTGAAGFGLVGGVLGGLAGAQLASMENPDNAAGGAVLGALALGGTGFVIGMFIGGLSEYEHWEPVPVAPRSSGMR